MPRFVQWIQEHWLPVLISLVVGGIVAIATVWPAFTHDTVPERFKAWGLTMPGLRAAAFTLVLFMIALLSVVARLLVRTPGRVPVAVAKTAADVVEEEAAAIRQLATRQDVRQRVAGVNRWLIANHEATDKALRACMGALKVEPQLVREFERLLTMQVGAVYAEIGELNTAVGRSQQSAPEDGKLPIDALAGMMVETLANQFRLGWALENIRRLPDVMLARLPEIGTWLDTTERLRAELRPLLHHDRFDLRPIAAQLGTRAIPSHAPRVVPVRWGHREATPREKSLDQGLFVENLEGPAMSVVADPFSLGRRRVVFERPEINQLKKGDAPILCSAHVEETPGRVGIGLFAPFREWQAELGDTGRETVGKIYYDDFEGNRFVTYYRIGVDVLNRDAAMVVEFLEQGRVP
jgi:hypothetical protein